MTIARRQAVVAERDAETLQEALRQIADVLRPGLSAKALAEVIVNVRRLAELHARAKRTI